jgi:hypothetical protein
MPHCPAWSHKAGLIRNLDDVIPFTDEDGTSILITRVLGAIWQRCRVGLLKKPPVGRDHWCLMRRLIAAAVKCLDAHILKTTANDASQAVPRFGFSVETLRPPAIALIEAPLFLSPAKPSAPRPPQRRYSSLTNSLIGPPFGEAKRPQ